ncbi:MAG: DUF4838 domain-containing protein [Clostridiales bacterium]|nr:DUF4838 domain-containing protein [Clostridiales bacterium]
MKKMFCVLLCALVLLTGIPFIALASGAEPCTIALSDSATDSDRRAAETLQRYLAKILPAEPQIYSDATQKADFVIGGMSDGIKSEAVGSYSITRQESGPVFIRGIGRRGIISGVYAFLRDYCGCRWYAPEEIILPEVSSLSFPETIDVSYTPFFEYTATDWRTMCDSEIAEANDLTGNGCYISGFCHTLTRQFCSRDTYFEEHPEYFALHKGKRTPNQLCLTNPDTLRIVTGEVLDVLKNRHDPNADLQIISITQDDNSDFCECAACKALDDKNGSHAGTNVTFANAVADAVKEAGYDNVAIDTFAYSYTRKTPTNVVPRDNVIIRLCDIECCFCHTLDDKKCKENRSFIQDLADWGKICRRIYIWDYTTNYFETPCLYPDFGVLQRNMQIFYENNAKGIFEEGEPSSDDNAEFGELRAYLLAQLMQNPYMDFDAQTVSFMNAYYGAAGEPLYRFLQRITEKSGASYFHHLGVFPDSTDTLTCFTAADITYAEECWREAKEKTQNTPYYARVERSELCWRFWKAENRKGEFSPLHATLYMRMNERKNLYDDLARMGVTYISHARRNREITECMSLVLLRCPGKWCRLFEEPYWDAIEPFILWLYNTLGKIKRV